MIAHVNEAGIVLRFDAPDNLSREEWESLLDELKSRHIPGLYPHGKRSQAQLGIVTIYLAPDMVTMDEAIAILQRRNIEVSDVRENPSAL